jgi:excisionase family DNA binding protein
VIDDAKVFTVKDLAARWGCQQNTVYRAIKEGRIAAFKPGSRTLRVALHEVLRFEKARAA